MAQSEESLHTYQIESRVQPAVHADFRNKNVHYRHDYDFTPEWNWFGANDQVWKVVLKEFMGRENVNYLEVGCFEGRASMWVLENVLTHPTSRLTSIDPFGLFPDDVKVAETMRQRFSNNVAKSGAAGRVTIIQGFSQEELRQLPQYSFDVAYLDGDHSAKAVLEDAVLCWRLLKPGGVLMFDDYRIDRSTPMAGNPMKGADYFLDCFRDEIEVLHSEYQLIVKKHAPAG